MTMFLKPASHRRTASPVLTLIAAACLLIGAAAQARKVTWEDIVNDDKTTGDVLSYGMGMKAQRHSPLKKINKDNVANIVPAWSFSFGGEKQRGQECRSARPRRTRANTRR